MEDRLTIVTESLDQLIGDIQDFLAEANRRNVTYEPSDVADRLLDMWNLASAAKATLEN